jgi:hypothetical protein
VSNEKKEIKVTDKRMFTADGDLKEEYRFLSEKSTSAAEAEPSEVPPMAAAAPQPEPPRREPPRAVDPGPGADYSTMPPELGGPAFYDLVAMMAEPVPIYLGDARLPDGQTATNLEMARLHIDLLEVLREKTLGNLTAQESSFLEDQLYRLRVRYVQKTR